MLSKNTILIPQVSGSEEVDLDGIEFLLRQQCPEMFSGNYYPTGGLFPEGAVLVNGDFGEELNGDLTAVTTMANTLSAQTKPTAKKDRHSKIFTAQGPRDRRVRLSIDIARRFFDLQEMLGFDKPSKTLDWLLTKSRAAINELAQTKQNGSGSSLSEYDEAAAVSYDTGEAFENGPNSVKTPKTKDPAASHTSSKESRAKARARARERTREKMCIKQLNGGCGSLSIPTQNWDNQFEDFRSSAGPSSFNPNAGLSQPILACALNNADLIHESIVVQRKPKNPSFWGFQQNLNAASAVAAAENGDICSFSAQSNMCAIWDHHKKFFNSTTSNQ